MGVGVAALGIATVVPEKGERLDTVTWLRERKSRKYMGLQDELAVVSAGRALLDAGSEERELGDRTGLYVAVGYIPFVTRDIDPVLAASLDDEGGFSMARFAGGGYQRAHPLLAFRCLPNMPAYHVAANFGITGPYRVLYPSAGQLHVALEEAVADLLAERIDRALVCGVAHQDNFLVRHHNERLGVAGDRLRDAAACIVLERESGKLARARLEQLTIRYAPYDPTLEVPGSECELELGPAAPLIALERAVRQGQPAALEISYAGRDAIHASSRWRW